MSRLERETNLVRVDFKSPEDRGRFLAPLVGPNRPVRGRRDYILISDLILLEGSSIIVSEEAFKQASRFNGDLPKSSRPVSVNEADDIRSSLIEANPNSRSNYQKY